MKNNATLIVRVPAQTRAEIVAIANKQAVKATISEVVRHLLEIGIAEEKQCRELDQEN